MESINHLPVLQLLSKINKKQITPQMLSPRARQNVVDHLICQGFSVAEIASTLNVSDHTVLRDRQLIRGRHAVFSDQVGFTQRIVGMMVNHMEESIARLRRIQRDSDTKQRDRIMAERSMAYVFNTFVKRFQSIGYIPRHAERDASYTYKPMETGLADTCESLTCEQNKAREEKIKELKPFSYSTGVLGPDTLASDVLEKQCPPPSMRSTEWEARTGMTRKERREWRKLEKMVAKIEAEARR